MDLAFHQRRLLDLIKAKGEVRQGDDPYLAEVARSRSLELVREISIWWRAVGIETACPFTSVLLKMRELFDAHVREGCRAESSSPFIAEQAAAFLERTAEHEDPLLRSVARFELALIRIGAGSREEHVVEWQQEPYRVLQALLRGEAPRDPGEPGLWRTVVARHLPHGFRVIRCDPEDVAD